MVQSFLLTNRTRKDSRAESRWCSTHLMDAHLMYNYWSAKIVASHRTLSFIHMWKQTYQLVSLSFLLVSPYMVWRVSLDTIWKQVKARLAIQKTKTKLGTRVSILDIKLESLMQKRNGLTATRAGHLEQALLLAPLRIMALVSQQRLLVYFYYQVRLSL